MIGAKRIVLIGLDGANFESVKPLINEGRLPNLARLIRNGTLCVNALAPYPTLTGSNWATIATGAWPGTHGVTDMSYHVSGEPLDCWHNGFTSDAVEAETLWETVSRAGKKAVVLKYPGSWPARNPDIVMTDGGGGRPFWGGSYLELSHSQLFSTIKYPNGNSIKLTKAESWDNLPASRAACLEVAIDFVPESGNVPDSLCFGDQNLCCGEPKQFFALITASGDSGYDTIYLCTARDTANALAVVKSGEWSQSFHCQFNINDKVIRGGMRFKVMELSPEGKTLTIYFAQVYPTDGFSQPSGIGAELVDKFGAYINHPGYSEEAMGWFYNSPETFLELMEYQNQWLGKAGAYLLQTIKCDLFAMQCHCIDFANHAFIPRGCWDKKTCNKKLSLLARCYESVDNMVGDIVAGLDPESIVCVVSDHGATESPYTEVFVNPILKEAGLLFYENNDEAVRRPDYKKSLAVSERACNIYINLRGREPWGIVSPDKYESLRDKVIDALLKWRHPETDQNPFSIVMRKEDVRPFGLFDNLGRDIGDIVYALRPEYDHEHGRQLPTVTCGGHSMKPLLLFSGTGIKEGLNLERTVWLVDVAPTLAFAMNWPMPTECEGAVLYQIFEGHSSLYPRPEFLEKQTEYKKRLEKKLSLQDKNQPQKDVKQIKTKEPAETVKEKLPETVGELREELKKARAEARRWKSVYEQYHRITHGN